MNPGLDKTYRPDETYGKEGRLRKRWEFLTVQRRGKKIHLGDLLCMVREHPGQRRVGFTVSKKVGNAVVRNRVKRLLRETWRRQRHGLPVGYDLVFVAKRSAGTDLTWSRLQRQFNVLRRKLSSQHR